MEPEPQSYYTGDEWRWRLRASSSLPSIQVIEPTVETMPPPGARRVPFGFGRVLAGEPVPAEPQLWEGSD